MYKRFSAIFTFTENPAKVVIPETFATKVKGWLGGNEKLFNNVKDQVFIYFCNSIYIFNPPPLLHQKKNKTKKKTLAISGIFLLCMKYTMNDYFF